MDTGRVILTLAQAYSIGLVVIGTLTLLWLFDPNLSQSPQVAGLWFAVGGFGLLVAMTFVIVHLSRD